MGPAAPRTGRSVRIDSHQHFWRYNDVEYSWISDDMQLLRRDFLPADLKPEIAAVGVTGIVSVQARQTVEETRFLLGLARENDFILGVVGWAPLIDDRVRETLESFADETKLKAYRHVLEDEPDGAFMLRPDFNAGVRAVTETGLIYDILILEKHLPQTLEFVDRHPNQVFVLDHIAKPRICDGSRELWRGRILQLARRDNVYCKISGMVTEANWLHWTEAQLRPYLDTVLDAFGPRRLMFGSDWPLCMLAAGYGRWHTCVAEYVSSLGGGEQERILGGTALEAYGLAPPEGVGSDRNRRSRRMDH